MAGIFTSLGATQIAPAHSGATKAAAEWVLDPTKPGEDLPPQGRSLFDQLIGADPVPFPFAALLGRIESELAPGEHLNRPIKRVLIPLGRSLQRQSAAPEFFRYPRVVVAVDGEPTRRPGQGGLLLRDRLYLGYLEKAAILEVISYNESAGRFEYQIVRGYRADGERAISYAPRALCQACHQNGAPIFARPLWDETNANPQVAGRLAAEHRDFYGLPLEPGIDEAYAVDNATDRANGLSLTQRLWSEGCGEAKVGAACRAALLLRAIQWRLSGGRGFDQGSADYRQDLVAPLASHQERLWPEGFKIPNPDIPNRQPLESRRPLPESQSFAQAKALFGASDIPAIFEPLAPRDPLEIWRPDPTQLTTRAVTGLAEFLAEPDLERLDQWLTDLAAPATRLHLDCDLDRQPASAADELWHLVCRGAGTRFEVRVQIGSQGQVSGRIPALDLDGQALGEIRLAGQQLQSPAGPTLMLAPSRLGQSTRLRLPDGRRLSSLELHPGTESRALLTLSLVDDLDPLVQALTDLAAVPHEALAPAPFQRSIALAALFEHLGMPLTWCCGDAAPLPPLRGPGEVDADEIAQPGQSSAPATALEPFIRVCARCHRTPESFPPNFLYGPPGAIGARVAGCAERIAFRLGMWTKAPEDRPKTPMPPHFVLASLGVDPADWPSHPELASLRLGLESVMRDQGHILPPIEALLARDYGDLPPCLPEPTTGDTAGAVP